ncbi:hypothetical protein AVEN_253998-1 [Araneus ventricosus]|uniref:HTH psq-type domain-containing protein n=1 Tax=Araneus ventricosus TaxID=182803 RepID=A0A4Y2E828_ARAVE|nr:hypothetical protein AVEN_253998-1 [Araneus ventricosus]
MATRGQLSFQDKLNIIKGIDDGMKQVDAVKKYLLSQSKIANFLKKRKPVEEAVNSDEINPQRKRLKVATNENIDAAVDSMRINIENKEEPFKAVNVKEACGNIAGSWWEVTKKTIHAEECISSLQKSLTQLAEKSGKMSGINVEEYLIANDDLMVFSGVAEEVILSEITDEMEKDDEENDGIHTDIPASSAISSVPTGILFKPFIHK